MNNWTNQKITYREYIKEYVDIDTGEIIEEHNFKLCYEQIATETKKEYGKNKCITTSRKLGKNKHIGQIELFRTD